MKTKEMIYENNELRDLLTTENRKFYEDLLVLVRIKSLFRDEKIYEEILLMIVQDLIEAQRAGLSAEDFLGRDIYTIADEIVAETPKRSILDNVKLSLIILGVYLLVSLVPSTVLSLAFSANHTASISIAGEILSSIFTLVIVWGFFSSASISRWLLRLNQQKFLKSYVQLILPCLAIVGIYFILNWLTRHTWTISISF